jgi:alpha-ribazole phosphatase
MGSLVTRIVLVRHGAVDAVGTAYGQRVDPALSDHGRVEVTRLRERIDLVDPTAVVRSPALRTRQSAELLDLVPDEVDARWAERDLGDWEGRPWQELWSDVPEEVKVDPTAFAAFTPPDGEPLTDLRTRVTDALEDLGRRHGRDDPSAHAPVVVVCHGGPITCAVAHVLGLDETAMLKLRVGTATSTWVTRWPDGSWTVERLGA